MPPSRAGRGPADSRVRRRAPPGFVWSPRYSWLGVLTRRRGLIRGLLSRVKRHSPMARLETDSNGRSPVGLRGGRQSRRQPFFVLHGRGYLPFVVHKEVRACRSIVQSFATGEEVAWNLGAAIAELEIGSCAEGISGPSLEAGAFAADPTADDIALIGAEVVVEVVEVNELAMQAGGRSVGVGGLYVEVELRQFRKVREVNTGLDGGAAGRADRRNIVGGEGIRVKSEPVTQKGKPVGKLEARGSFTGIRAAPKRIGFAEAEITVEERGRRDWAAKTEGASQPCIEHGHNAGDGGTAHFREARETKLEIFRRFETDFFAVEDGPGWEFVAGKFAHESVDFHRAEVVKDPRKRKGNSAAGAKHVNGGGIVTEEQRAAFALSPPETLFSERKIPAAHRR